MLPWNPPSAFSLAGGNNNAGNSTQREGGGGGGFSPYADGQMTQQQHQQQTQQLHQQQQQQQQQQGGGQQQAGPQNGGGAGGPPANQNQAYPPMTLASTLHFLQSEHRRYARDRNEWEIERAEMRARIALLEGEKRGNEGALKSLARRCKMLEMALRGERSKFLTSSIAPGVGTGGLGTGHAAASSAAVSVGGGASPAMSGTASPVPGGALSLASALGTAGASIPPNKLVALQTLTASPVSTPGEAPKSIPMATSTSSPGQAAGHQNPPTSVSASGTGRSDSVSSGSGPTTAAANGFQSGTWASTAPSASGHSAAHAAGGLRDPRGKARSRDYLKQCLQEITYLTSSATLNPLAAHSYAAPGVPRPRKVLPDQVPATSAPGVLNLGGGAAATTSVAAASVAVAAPASSAATTTTAATEATPSSGSSHPGAEFEPVAASSIATATPVGFPPVSTSAASSSTGPDVFDSAPTPTPVSNGLLSSPGSSEVKPVEEGEPESEEQTPFVPTATEAANEDDDEVQANDSGASDPPSAFVPLKRQVSQPSGTSRGSNRSKKSVATDSTKANDADDVEDLDKAIAELSLPSERDAQSQPEVKPAETVEAVAASTIEQEDSATKDAPDAPEEVQASDAKEEVPSVESEASEAQEDKAADSAETVAPKKQENGIKSVKIERSQGDEAVSDLGTISRGRGRRAGVASLFGGLEDGGNAGQGIGGREGQSGMSSPSSLPTRAEELSVDSAANGNEEISTALFRPDEGWKEKLAAAGRRAYPRAVVGGDAELEALAWDLDDDEAWPKDPQKATDPATRGTAGDSPRFKPGRVLRSHLDAVRVVKVIAAPAAAEGDHAVEAVSGSDDCTVKIWHDLIGENKRRGELEPVATYRGHAGPITALGVTESDATGSKVILSGSLDSTVCIWRYPTAERSTYDPVDESVLLGTIETHGDAVWGIEPLRNDRFACITADGSVQIWEWPTSTLERSWQYRASNPNLRGSLSKKPPSVQVPTAMALFDAQDGTEQLVVSFQNGDINLYDPEVPERELKTLVSCESADGTPERQINSLAVDLANLRLLVGSEDRSIGVFSLTDGSRLCSFTAHLDGVTSLASVSSDIFVSASHDTSIRIWSLTNVSVSAATDSASARCIQDLQAHRTKGAEGVLVVAMSAGHLQPVLVSAGADGTLRVWCSE